MSDVQLSLTFEACAAVVSILRGNGLFTQLTRKRWLCGHPIYIRVVWFKADVRRYSYILVV